jgi:uncharacterized membrane protein
MHTLSGNMQLLTPPETQPAPASGVNPTERLHRLLTILTAVFFVSALVMLWMFAKVPDQPDWPDALLLSLAAAGTVVALARQLPWQNVLWTAFVIALIGGAAHVFGAVAKIPFGPFVFGPETGPRFFKTLPWAMPLLWIVALLNSRGVARLILRPWRKTHNYGFRLIGLTAALATAFDFALDPFASRVKHYWLWTPTKFPITWQGAPLVNFLGWAFVSLFILAFITPVLINKNPLKRPADFHPLGIWLGAFLFFAIASALNGLWLAAAADAGIGVVTVVFAIRGAQW